LHGTSLAASASFCYVAFKAADEAKRMILTGGFRMPNGSPLKTLTLSMFANRKLFLAICANSHHDAEARLAAKGQHPKNGVGLGTVLACGSPVNPQAQGSAQSRVPSVLADQPGK